MEFVYLSPFEKRAKEIGFGETDRLLLEIQLLRNPDDGDVIPGAAGIRKMRFAGSGRGKRGGARVIYFFVKPKSKILLISVYAKNEGADLTKAYLKALANLVKEELK